MVFGSGDEQHGVIIRAFEEDVAFSDSVVSQEFSCFLSADDCVSLFDADEGVVGDGEVCAGVLEECFEVRVLPVVLFCGEEDGGFFRRGRGGGIV